MRVSLNQSSTVKKRQIMKQFKMRGLSIHSDATDAVINVLQREESQNQKEKLQIILNEIKKYPNIMVVTKEKLSEVVALLSESVEDVMNESIQLLQAYETPRLEYDAMFKRFCLKEKELRSFHSDANSKVDMLQQRFVLVQQRIQRLEKASFGDMGALRNLCSIESLLGKSGMQSLLALVTQVEENQYYLEDLTGHVRISLANVIFLSHGFITEQSVVVAEGEISDNNIFIIHKIGHPPCESRIESTNILCAIKSDIFGVLESKQEIEKVQ